MTRSYSYKRHYVRQIPLFQLPEGADSEEAKLLEIVDEAEKALKGQRRILAEYERKIRQNSDEYARLNLGKKRRKGTWYR